MPFDHGDRDGHIGEPREPDQSPKQPTAISNRRSAATLALVLGTVAWIQIVAAAAHGLTQPTTGTQGFTGNSMQRLGAGFLNDIGTATSLLPLVGVLLTYYAVVLGATAHTWRSPLIVCATAAIAVFVGSLLALSARLHQFGLAHVRIPTYQRWALVAYLAGNVGVAVTTVAASVITTRHAARLET